MLIRLAPDHASADLPSDITPKTAYLNRRTLLQQSVGLGLLTGLGAAWSQTSPTPTVLPGKLPALPS